VPLYAHTGKKGNPYYPCLEMKAKEAEICRESSAPDFPEVPLIGREFHAGQQKRKKNKRKPTKKPNPKSKR